MHIHFLGICGTFMGGLALLARGLGHRVTGSDAKAYPPMSDLLREQGIEVIQGYEPEQLEPAPDCVIVGNALTRGNPAVEYLLEHEIRYTSAPAFLYQHVLRGRHVLAVAGTHGKTTTTSMLAWILECAGMSPGFLVGGVPENFGISARIGGDARGPFVVEADEYDSAFFDKRSKFVHYHPRTLVINNVEFDHADIFDDLDDVKRQFHHLVRTLPASGRIVAAAPDANIDDVLSMGCWTPVERFGIDSGDWRGVLVDADGGRFRIKHDGSSLGQIRWQLIGQHNVRNAVAAVAAAHHLGVAADAACSALETFRNVKRRMEVRGSAGDVTVYDDFAHHPSAIRSTIEALRARVGAARILAVLDPASNSMRLGVYRDTLGPSLRGADRVWLFRPANMRWDLAEAADGMNARTSDDVPALVAEVAAEAKSGDHVLVMSNSGFGGFHALLLEALTQRAAAKSAGA
ncbi:MAG: UDP-N-acetylmuramate:L-alanyl-gamma-D-glutamyl-meso-diaminopimelate ligase [Gammaproteobacteria bacterium]|nr:UDP-N-acetylmuramate:L-alanyl-gamma-D-glutamyl-meso-diaminopimelate ligase [Gammaproteobacteria bacterium]